MALPATFPPPLQADGSGAPFLPRLLLEPALSQTGTYDGAWWPRSNHVRVELPDLITALTAHLGRIVRVGLDAEAWDDVSALFTWRPQAIDGAVMQRGREIEQRNRHHKSRRERDHVLERADSPAGVCHDRGRAHDVGARCNGSVENGRSVHESTSKVRGTLGLRRLRLQNNDKGDLVLKE